MSNQSHSAQIRAARIIGIRPEHIRMIPSMTVTAWTWKRWRVPYPAIAPRG